MLRFLSIMLVLGTTVRWCSSALQPGDVAPELSIPTLGGTRYKWQAGRTTLLAVYNSSEPAHRWAMANAWSLQTFLKLAPLGNVDYVFLSATGSGGEATHLAGKWRHRMTRIMQQQHMPAVKRKAWSRHLFFSTCSAAECMPWLLDVMQQWTAEGAQITVSTTGDEEQSMTVNRLDAWYDWVPRPANQPAPARYPPSSLRTSLSHSSSSSSSGSHSSSRSGAETQTCTLVYRADACQQLKVKGKWVLAPHRAACNYTNMAVNVQNGGGLGLVVQASRRSDVEVMMSADVDLDLERNRPSHGTAISITPSTRDANSSDLLTRMQEQPLLNTQLSSSSSSSASTLVVKQQQPQHAWSTQRRRLMHPSLSKKLTSHPSPYMERTSHMYGDDGDDEIRIPLTQVSYEDGQGIRDVIEAAGSEGAHVRFSMPQVPSWFVGVDSRGQLFEMGWTKVPTLMQLAWQAEYQLYLDRLNAELQQHPPQLAIQLLQEESTEGEHGVTVWRDLPDADVLASFTCVTLDMSLMCAGPRDADCPQWDHVVQLYACCGDDCHDCAITPWAAPHPAGKLHTHSDVTPQCGFEFGRWVTPFRRRIGHWLTDITPLLPLLQPGRCAFTMQLPPWAGSWRASLSLGFSRHRPSLPEHGHSHFSTAVALDLQSSEEQLVRAPSSMLQPGLGSSDQARHDGLVPFSTVPVFQGGVFDQHYNDRDDISVRTPHGTVRAILMAVISGHGSDDNNCAEFCPTSHHFIINGQTRQVSFDVAGTTWGCIWAVPHGSIPNEHGTWFYGRNGWCDGQQVQPWLADVTDLLAPAGSNTTLQYQGLYQGKTPCPDPEAQPGEIMMASYLTFFKLAVATF